MSETKIFQAFIMLILVFSEVQVVAQQIEIDTEGIHPLIEEWNFANNEHSTNAFLNVYGEELLFYTQHVTRDKAIAFKQKLFKQKPAFQQRISGDINFTPYSTGVIKCEFTKEAFERSGWKKYDAYLLVSYEQNRFWIVGESDEATDRTLKFIPDLGEPIVLSKPDSLVYDSSAVLISGQQHPVSKSVKDTIAITTSRGLMANILSDTPVQIRRDYLFLLIGVLIAGGLMIFIADTLSQRRREKTIPKPSETELTIIGRKRKLKFESFAITLFDPMYFSIRKYRLQKVMVGVEGDHENLPHLHVTFRNKDIEHAIAVHCIFREVISGDQIELFKSKELEDHRHFEDEYKIDLYYIVGLGGDPDDPKELYLIPSDALQTTTIQRSKLSSFRKSGMFFYNSSAKRLQ